MEYNSFDKNDLDRGFKASDIGKIFWRVEYRGIMTQCIIHSVNADGDAIIQLGGLTDLRNEEYKLKDTEDITFGGSSTYGMEYLKRDEYHFDFEEAKTASYERYLREVNPFGECKVARYFDDVFETYVKDPVTKEDLVFNKKDAKAEANRQNDAKPRAYVYYDIRAVK